MIVTIASIVTFVLAVVFAGGSKGNGPVPKDGAKYPDGYDINAERRKFYETTSLYRNEQKWAEVKARQQAGCGSPTQRQPREPKR